MTGQILHLDALFHEVEGAPTAPEPPGPTPTPTTGPVADDADAERTEGPPTGARGRTLKKHGTRGRSKSRGSRSRSRDRSTFVVKAKGAVVRAAVDLGSAKVAKLAEGAVVVVDRTEETSEGKVRYHIAGPPGGWISAASCRRATK